MMEIICDHAYPGDGTDSVFLSNIMEYVCKTLLGPNNNPKDREVIQWETRPRLLTGDSIKVC